LDAFARFNDFSAFLVPDPEAPAPPAPCRFEDPWRHELAGAQRRLLEIRRIGRKNLPARYLLPEYLNESHISILPSDGLPETIAPGPHSPVPPFPTGRVYEMGDGL